MRQNLFREFFAVNALPLPFAAFPAILEKVQIGAEAAREQRCPRRALRRPEVPALQAVVRPGGVVGVLVPARRARPELLRVVRPALSADFAADRRGADGAIPRLRLRRGCVPRRRGGARRARVDGHRRGERPPAGARVAAAVLAGHGGARIRAERPRRVDRREDVLKGRRGSLGAFLGVVRPEEAEGPIFRGFGRPRGLSGPAVAPPPEALRGEQAVLGVAEEAREARGQREALRVPRAEGPGEVAGELDGAEAQQREERLEEERGGVAQVREDVVDVPPVAAHELHRELPPQEALEGAHLGVHAALEKLPRGREDLLPLREGDLEHAEVAPEEDQRVRRRLLPAAGEVRFCNLWESRDAAVAQVPARPLQQTHEKGAGEGVRALVQLRQRVVDFSE